MDSAMLPALRTDNTFTSKTEIGRKEPRLGGGINLGITDGVFCTGPPVRVGGL